LWIQAVVTNLDDAHEQIDTAVATALRESKPVYLSISCNLPGLTHPTFSRDPVPFFLTPRYHPALFISFFENTSWKTYQSHRRRGRRPIQLHTHPRRYIAKRLTTPRYKRPDENDPPPTSYQKR
jgi:hypothetical protein